MCVWGGGTCRLQSEIRVSFTKHHLTFFSFFFFFFFFFCFGDRVSHWSWGQRQVSNPMPGLQQCDTVPGFLNVHLGIKLRFPCLKSIRFTG